MDDPDYQFTVDWFSKFIPIWEQLIDQKHPSRMVEIGAYEGKSSCYLIERCAEDRPVDLWCIDTWEGGVDNDPTVMGEVEKRFDHNIAIATARAKHPVTARKLKQMSNLGLATLAEERGPTMDLIYIDGSHQAPDVLSDAVIGFSLLKVGGLMIFDDYLWHMEPLPERDPLNMPKPGIDAFMNLFMRKMLVFSGAPLGQLYAEKVAL